MNLRVHALEPVCHGNGPGPRFVIWVQGCTLACPGCFNPQTHASDVGEVMPVADLRARVVAARRDIAGVTLTGGEPMQQPDGVLALLAALRTDPALAKLSLLMFSGFTRAEILRQRQGRAILGHLDVLIDGRYRADEPHGVGLRGSGNQQVVRLSDRHDAAELAAVPPAAIKVTPEGRLVVTGVAPPPVQKWPASAGYSARNRS